MMRVRLETKQLLDVDDAEWQTVWSGNFSAAIGDDYQLWTASLFKDRMGRSLVCVVCDESEGNSEAVGELGRPLAEDIPPILRRLCERVGLEDFPETWEIPALHAAKRNDAS
jgi:hypothetical protein